MARQKEGHLKDAEKQLARFSRGVVRGGGTSTSMESEFGFILSHDGESVRSHTIDLYVHSLWAGLPRSGSYRTLLASC